MLSKQELLIPRFKVLINYPDSRYQVGQVITLNNQDASGRHYYEYADHDGLYNVFEIEFANYPDVFKRLLWYEERDINDLPAYVKFPSGLIEKATKWEDHGGGNFYFEKNGYRYFMEDRYSQTFPATKEEYRIYMKQFNK